MRKWAFVQIVFGRALADYKGARCRRIPGAKTMSKSYQIMLADDHVCLRKALISVLGQNPEFRVTEQANDGLEVLNLLHRGIIPDLLILDLSMPSLSGIEVLHQIKQMDFALKVLIWTMHKEPDFVCQAFITGASGYMLKDAMVQELLPALHTLIESRIYLSPLMAKALPDTCQVKIIAERGLPFSSAIHCARNVIVPRGNAALHP